jgi:hypothetical protein
VAIEAIAMMVPTKLVRVPSVAKLPTTQNTLQGWTPPISLTTLSDAVIRELSAWKMNAELASPLRTSSPVRLMLELA